MYFQVNYLLAVPSLVVILCKSVILDNYDVSSVEIIQSGGASLEKNVLLDVKKRLVYTVLTTLLCTNS